jgi:cell division septation protein DedD
MNKPAALFFFCLLGLVGLASAQNRPVGGAFAAVPTPGQPAAPVTPSPTAPPSPGVARPTTPQAPGAKPEEQLRIVADPATNSLIIYGTTQEFQNVRNILRELDAIPRQVLIESLILQVDLKDTEDFGVDYQILTKSRQTIFGKTFGSSAALLNLGKLSPAAPFFSGINGLSAIVGDDTVSALIRAAATDSRIKLISAPSVLASDNRPARIQVGSEEPIATSSSSQTAGTIAGSLVTTNQIQYRNTGRILTIIPQVNAQGLVNLQIKAEVSARGDDVKVGNESFPAFNTQDAETTAIVHDGETLVIGGLIGERKSKGRSGIPYLMDLPIVGRFFGATSEATDRTELIMLITPRVIRNRDESRSVTEEFKSKISTVRNELEKIQRDQELEIEKMKKLRQEPPMPAVPTPPAVEPQPPPVTAPAQPGAYFGPRNPSVAPRAPLVESSVGRDDSLPPAETQGDLDAVLAALESAVDTAGSEKPVGAAAAAGTSSERLDTATAAGARTKEGVPQAVKVTRVWVVQVGAVAQAKDADLLAKRLRDKGYDVRVVTADIGGKTWHRVQVGELASQQEAFELKKYLKSAEKMDQAFVARR